MTEEDFKQQRVKIKRGSTVEQTWDVDVGKEWVSSQHQSVEQQITSDPLKKGLARNKARSWWIALDTMKEIEKCLKKLGRGVSRKCRSWATKGRSDYVGTEEPIRTNLGEIFT